MGAMAVDFWKLATDFEPDVDDELVSEVEPEAGDNVIEGLDFENLASEEDDTTIKAMHLILEVLNLPRRMIRQEFSKVKI